MAKLVSKTYGDALSDLAIESGHIDDIMSEAKDVDAILGENKDFSKFMANPRIAKEDKIQVLKNVFKGRISDDLLGLLEQMVSKGRYGDIHPVIAYFIARMKEYKNVGTVSVTSALPLTETQKKLLEKKLLATTKYEGLEADYQVDKSLIGGMIVRIGDRVVDGSVRNKLQRLSGELAKTQLKVGEYAP